MKTSKIKDFWGAQKSGKISDTSIKITLIVVVTVVFLALLGAFVFFQMQPENTLTSSGISTVSAMPDLVSVYFNVETNGTTAKEAKDLNAEIVDEAITELVKLGLNRDEIITENFNVYPQYVWSEGERKQEGYVARHNIKVELKSDKTDDVGEVIDAGVDAGAGISYISFELSQELQNQYKAEALGKATEDARIKAEAIASGLNKNLGKVVSVSSSNFNYYPWRVYEATADAGMDIEEAKIAATNIQPGEREVTAQVSVVYEIK